ncbi:hypothetical protein FH972_013175 [Carpinus fangiana]|uniref:Armadillo repeat-containing domain-containing protein n=1 Tax=Carpinus fangiana TaxID=176857 RepID=A0A5N6R9E6_9ROSI|nr:hypothetical protein FH972_013175 [Carpinus fangiana]
MSEAQLRETIVDCVSDALSDSHEGRQKALQITKISPQNRNLLVQTDAAIPVIETLSLSILFNLSLNPDLKRSLADMETISHLNSMIFSSTCPESIRLASFLVCSLAMLDKNKAKFGVAGTIQLLVKAIAGSRVPATHHLLSSLAELVQFQGNCTVAVRSGAVQVLIQIVESTDGEDLAVLCLLARFDEGLNALRKSECDGERVEKKVHAEQGGCGGNPPPPF